VAFGTGAVFTGVIGEHLVAETEDRRPPPCVLQNP
jgi:hypothetical protein